MTDTRKVEYLDDNFRWTEIPFPEITENMIIRFWDRVGDTSEFSLFTKEDGTSEFKVTKSAYRQTYPDINLPRPLGSEDGLVWVVEVETKDD